MRIPDSFILEPNPAAPTLVQQAIKALEERLRNGSLKPGDLLPSERAFAEQFEVSRTVVRGVVADLLARGLLETVPGGGYRVSVPTTEHLSDTLSYLLRGASSSVITYHHISAVRRVLEIEIAGLAALNHTTADLTCMTEWLAIMTVESGPTEAYCKADVAFHRALAVATQNPLFVILLDTLADVLTDVRRSGMNLYSSVERGMGFHRTIFECVVRRDADGARITMEAHLTDSEKIQEQVAEMLGGS